MKTVLISAREEFAADEKTVRRVLSKLDKILNLDNKYLEVFLVDDSFMKKNVLSFESPKDFPHPESKNYQPMGEIYLNPKYIKEHGEDLTLMLVHGLLHLLGYDHKNKSDRMKMEAEEQRLCRAIKS